MEFPSSLNKAKPTELWQIERPDINERWPKIAFFKWKWESRMIPVPDAPASPENVRNKVRHRPYALAPAKRRVQHHPGVLIQLPDMRFDANKIAGRIAGELGEYA